jgi:hypothetical protein
VKVSGAKNQADIVLMTKTCASVTISIVAKESSKILTFGFTVFLGAVTSGPWYRHET